MCARTRMCVCVCVCVCVVSHLHVHFIVEKRNELLETGCVSLPFTEPSDFAEPGSIVSPMDQPGSIVSPMTVSHSNQLSLQWTSDTVKWQRKHFEWQTFFTCLCWSTECWRNFVSKDPVRSIVDSTRPADDEKDGMKNSYMYVMCVLCVCVYTCMSHHQELPV